MSDPKRGHPPRKARVKVGRFSVQVPASRALRLVAGTLLILGGFVGFLPVLGFWMIPLGLLVLSIDLAPVRKLRRRMEIRWGRRKPKKSR